MPPPRGLVQWLDQSLHRNGLLPRRARLLLAVSGGADSVALLRLLEAVNQSDFWQWNLVVGHVDHGIRGAASRADARFVQALAKQWRLPCVVKRLRLRSGCSEDTARQARLTALARLAGRQRCRGVVMAHHADDQAETVLMKMFRGCGLEGLMGMAEVSQVEGLWIYRPLLEVRRAALRDYLKAVRQPWREDQSNAAPRYARNRVRSQVLPVVEKIWPRAVEAIGRMSRVSAEARRLIVDGAQAIRQRAAQRSSARRIVLSRNRLRTWDALLAEVIRRAVEQVGGTREIASFERIGEVVRLVQAKAGGKRIEVGRGVVVRIEGQRVIVERPARRRRR